MLTLLKILTFLVTLLVFFSLRHLASSRILNNKPKEPTY